MKRSLLTVILGIFLLSSCGILNLPASQRGNTKSNDAIAVDIAASWVGPYTNPGPGSTANFSGTAGDQVQSLDLRIQKDGDPNQCLNSTLTAFSASCSSPDSLIAVSGLANWIVPIPLSLFDEGDTYTISVVATDTSNTPIPAPTPKSFTWSNAPAAPAGFTVVADQGFNRMTWSTATAAIGYLVVANPTGPVTFTPTNGILYHGDQTLGGGQYVVHFGAGRAAGDYGLTAGQDTHYALFAYSSYMDYTQPTTGEATTLAIKFPGATFATAAISRLISAFWQPADNCSSGPGHGVWDALISLAENFSGSPAVNVSGCTDNASYAAAAGNNNYLIAREYPTQDTNVNEFHLNLAHGYNFKLTGVHRHGNPALNNNFAGYQSFTADRWGNGLIGDAYNINVICWENKAASYCRDRTIGTVYTIAGNSSMADGADGGIATMTPSGSIVVIKADRHGNIYFGDSNYSKWRVLCNQVWPGVGYCAGKLAGHVYVIYGNGTVTNPAQDVLPAGQPIPGMGSMAIDNFGNLYLSGGTITDPWVVTALCLDTGSDVGFCAGRTAGHILTAVGGVSADGLDAVGNRDLVNGGFYLIWGMDFDAHGNLFMLDIGFQRLRVSCFQTGAPGFCKGKNYDYMYRLSGTGVGGNNADNTVANVTAMYGTSSLVVDSLGNAYWGNDSSTVRVVCNVVDQGGFCSGKTVGNEYWVYNYAPANMRHMGMDEFGNPIWADIQNAGSVRVYCQDTANPMGPCAGKSQGSEYIVANPGPSVGTWDVADGLPSVAAFHPSPYATTVDPRGNIYFKAGNRIYVICSDPSSNGVCLGKPAGYLYNLVGIDSGGVVADNTPGGNFLLYGDTGIAADSKGNVYFFNNAEAWVYCNDTSSGSGLCTGKPTVGNVYFVAGGGGSNADDQTPSNINLGWDYSLAVDSHFNVYFGMNAYVRVYCYDNTVGFCAFPSAKTVGHVSLVLGDGTTGMGASGAAASSVIEVQTVMSIAVDDGFNIYTGEYSNAMVRVVCYDASSGSCAGQVVGNEYYLIGTGGWGDAADNVAASGAKITPPLSIGVDSYRNVFIHDTRLRVVCYDTASSFCTSATIGNTYQLTDTSNDDLPSNVMGIGGTGGWAGVQGTMAIGPNGEIVIGDGTWSPAKIRVILP